MTYVTGGKIVLTKKLNPGDTTLYANVDLGITAGRLYFVNDNQVEWMNFTGKALVGSDWTYTGLTRQLSQTADPSTSAGSGYTWLAATEGKVVAMHDQLPDRQGGFQPGIYANAAARDAAIPSPSNGMSCYLTAEGVFSDYQSGAWADRANGATPNASETVAGKVEIATQVQTDAGTEIGETGAILSVTPKTLIQNTANITASQAEAEAGASNAKLMTPLRVQNKIDYTRASTAEAITGTDNVKFVTPAWVAAVRNRFSDSATTSGAGTITFTHGLGRIPKVVRIKALCAATAGNYRWTIVSNGEYDGTKYETSYSAYNGFSSAWAVGALTTAIALISQADGGGGSPDQSAWTVTTFDATSVVVTKTISNTDPGTIAYSVEIE